MRRWIVVGLLSLGIMLASAGTALATHCYVADKPDGAGTNGAFQREEGDPVDTFQWDLPDPAHERGSQTHGILELVEYAARPGVWGSQWRAPDGAQEVAASAEPDRWPFQRGPEVVGVTLRASATRDEQAPGREKRSFPCKAAVVESA